MPKSVPDQTKPRVGETWRYAASQHVRRLLRPTLGLNGDEAFVVEHPGRTRWSGTTTYEVPAWTSVEPVWLIERGQRAASGRP